MRRNTSLPSDIHSLAKAYKNELKQSGVAGVDSRESQDKVVLDLMVDFLE